MSAGTICAGAVVEGRDFKTGVARAVPGWGDVRLLAPHAELRLLACGQSALIDAQRLRCADFWPLPCKPALPCACSPHAVDALNLRFRKFSHSSRLSSPMRSHAVELLDSFS